MKVSAILLLATALCVGAYELDTLYKWKYIDFHYPNEEFKQNFKKWGYYNYSNILPTDVNQAPDGRMFVSMYGRNGSYIPLATISKEKGPSGPLLHPYPSWEFYNIQGPHHEYDPKIFSVYRTAFDKCNRMWVLDPGYHMDETVQSHGQPKLYIFDLKTDKIWKEIAVPKTLYGNKNWVLSYNVYPIIETHGDNCEHSYAYIANMNGNSLIVYDDHANKFHHYEDSTFGSDLEATDFIVADTRIEPKEVGFLELTLVPTYDEWDTYLLYYRPLISTGFWALNTTMLREHGIEKAKFFGARDYLKEPSFGQGYSDSEGAMFFGLTESKGIGCWNRWNENFEMDFIAKNDERLNWPVTLHVYGPEIWNKPQEELLVLSKSFISWYHGVDHLQQTVLGDVDFDDYNFWVLRAPVKEVVQGTKCAKSLYL